MPRVFVCLAAANLLLLIASGMVGLFSAKLGTDRHVLLALLTLLYSCFVQVAAFTYLTVTGKMIVQAVHLGKLSPHPIAAAKRWKRHYTEFMAALFGSVVWVTITGAAAWRPESVKGFWHPVAAGVVFLGHVIVLYFQLDIVRNNSQLMKQTLWEYEKARTRKKESQSGT